MSVLEEIEKKISAAPDEKTKVDLLNAWAFKNRNQHPAIACQQAEEALFIAEKNNYIKGKADSLMNMGFHHTQLANHERSFTLLLEGLSLFEQLNDATGIANAQYNLGILHLRVGNFDQAVDCLHKCLNYRESKNDKAGMASCYFQISYINQSFNDLEGAEEAANRSFELRKELNDKIGISAALMVLGEVHLKRKNYVKAKEILGESLRLREDSPEKLGYFATMLRWTELHMELKEFDVAEKFAQHGKKIASGENIRYGVMRFLQMLGKIQFVKNNIPEAKKYYTEALDYAESLSFKSVRYELYESMAEICKLEGDHKTALEYYQKFYKLKDEVISFQTNSQLKSVQLLGQIKFARKEAEIEKTKNAELTKAYDEIELKNKEILDSITYAKRLQEAILPPDRLVKSYFPQSFILYKPKDIVAGDFYWMENIDDTIFIAAADCTGHGVPGAMVSVVCSNALHRTVKEFRISNPGKILDKVRELVLETFEKSEGEVNDGMDISLLAINKKTKEIKWAGANNPLWYVEEKEFMEIRADKQPVGKYIDPHPFTTHQLKLKKDNCLYLFTDGYADQFGGPFGKKFKYKQLQEKLIAMNNNPIEEQKEILNNTFNEWKRDLEQIDDVCLIGIRV